MLYKCAKRTCRIYFYFHLIFLYFGLVFNGTIVLLELVK